MYNVQGRRSYEVAKESYTRHGGSVLLGVVAAAAFQIDLRHETSLSP